MNTTIFVPSSTRLYSDDNGNGPFKTVGQLTSETEFLVLMHRPGHAKPYLIARKDTGTQLGWVSVWLNKIVVKKNIN